MPFVGFIRCLPLLILDDAPETKQQICLINCSHEKLRNYSDILSDQRSFVN